MKVVLLAGGFGTRLSEYTDVIPKPMVQIGGLPILVHIMKHFSKYGHKDFIIALGYKSEVIKDFFINYKTLNSDFSIDFKTGELKIHNSCDDDWKVTLIDTGSASMTGGRLKRLEKYLENETFFLTYGDGLSNVNLDELLKKHKKHGKIATVTAVHPNARFGEMNICEDIVTEFKEKPQTQMGWINGGFFVMNPGIFNYIEGDQTVLEKEPLENLSKENELVSFKHEGFWQCMDSRRDKDYLEDLYINGNCLWKN